ncbi:adenylyltransferase/cytidyltransferase family protein [Ruminococcus sp.]|uniref:adenylyltransferase/cytidyltransferase family protein n=1 Tax=Ruminococcus sp. TaxID=41978 RepID=UPI0025F1B5A2|nr:adenylyltransferase/cytidyltransferase family protein [Ruminococcus sp.]MDD7555378.1 adenylyltransferase/cytidyltransferase family protein [Ruminococcus sp.]MDY4963814.1 adenylyltransferase/cytidyltransferase family protein [Ruminococcus callidus]
MKKYKIGYTQGVYDMFHIGHLNLINQAKERCEYLIVGVNSDQLVERYKNKTPVICQEDRRTIVANIKAVDQAVIADTLDKTEMLKQLGFDAVFIGDDWKGSERWQKTEEELSRFGVDVVYLAHTPDISSTALRKVKDNRSSTVCTEET